MRAPFTRITLFAVVGLGVSTYVVTLSIWTTAAFVFAGWLMLSEGESLAANAAAVGFYNTIANLSVHGLWIAALVFPSPGKRLVVLGFGLIWYLVVCPLGYFLWIWVTRRMSHKAVGAVLPEYESAFRPYAGTVTSIPRILCAMCFLSYGCSWMKILFGVEYANIWLIPVAYLAGVAVAFAIPTHGSPAGSVRGAARPGALLGLCHGLSAIRAYKVGNRRYRAGNFAGAAKAYTRAIRHAEQDPNADLLNLPDMYFNRALAHAALLDREKAHQDYEAAMNLNPLFAGPHFRHKLEENFIAAEANQSREMSGFDRLAIAAVRVKQMHLFRYVVLLVAASCLVYVIAIPKATGFLAGLPGYVNLVVDVFGVVLLLIMLVICIWSAVSAVRVYGRAAFRNSLRTAGIFRGTRLHRQFKGYLAVSSGLFAVSSILYWRFGWGLGLIALGLSGVLHWTFMTFRPAAVLFLGNSNEATIRMLAALRVATIEFRTVSLLDQDLAATPEMRSWAGTESFRTSDEVDWRSIVRRLNDFVRIIVIQDDIPSEGVVWEIREILANEPFGLVLHVCDDLHVCPALSEAIGDGNVRCERIHITNTVNAPAAVVGVLRGPELPSCIESRSSQSFVPGNKSSVG